METQEKIINYQLLWDKITHYAKTVGRVSSRPVLLLYYVLRSPDTPKSDKILIVSALSYLILPIDLLSAKRLPIIGWIDEIVSLTYAYQKVCKHITPEIEWKVDSVLDRWFSGVEYEIITE
jgi:uncharacterized membrane protein YkvA (DUF1232 family)